MWEGLPSFGTAYGFGWKPYFVEKKTNPFMTNEGKKPGSSRIVSRADYPSATG